jgi:hypothetical protein
MARCFLVERLTLPLPSPDWIEEHIENLYETKTNLLGDAVVSFVPLLFRSEGNAPRD